MNYKNCLIPPYPKVVTPPAVANCTALPVAPALAPFCQAPAPTPPAPAPAPEPEKKKSNAGTIAVVVLVLGGIACVAVGIAVIVVIVLVKKKGGGKAADKKKTLLSKERKKKAKKKKKPEAPSPYGGDVDFDGGWSCCWCTAFQFSACIVVLLALFFFSPFLPLQVARRTRRRNRVPMMIAKGRTCRRRRKRLW